jgi:rare lipoprotein A
VKTKLVSALGGLVIVAGFAAPVHAATGHALPHQNSATYYADKFEGRRTANNEIFKQNGLTAAHKTLPFGTRVKVINPDTDRSVIVKINDRIPQHGNSSIDLTKRAAKELGFLRAGRADVKLKILE